jgi:hypothetical protein
VGGDHHHGHLGIALVDQFGGFDPVQVWHADIRQDNIRVKVLGKLDHFIAVRGFTNDFDVGLGVEQYRETLPDHGMVISE